MDELFTFEQSGDARHLERLQVLLLLFPSTFLCHRAKSTQSIGSKGKRLCGLVTAFPLR